MGGPAGAGGGRSRRRSAFVVVVAPLGEFMRLGGVAGMGFPFVLDDWAAAIVWRANRMVKRTRVGACKEEDELQAIFSPPFEHGRRTGCRASCDRRRCRGTSREGEDWIVNLRLRRA